MSRQNLRMLDHPNVVRLYEVNEDAEAALGSWNLTQKLAFDSRKRRAGAENG